MKVKHGSENREARSRVFGITFARKRGEIAPFDLSVN